MNAGRKILIVDDDDALRQSLAEQLERDAEFSVTECDTATAALDVVKHERFDVMLLDVGLPDMDGRDLCRQLRQEAVNVPIVMLTAADSDGDTVQGLEAGANDYVTKPFRLNVLLARLRAHLRQSEHRDDAVFAIGPYTFQPGAKLMTDQTRRKKVRLTEKETAILRYLYHAGDRAIGRATLLDEVWGYNAGVTTHTLETHVYRLRQKIERDPANAEILITEPGGYRLLQ
jgi:DNA-binding response OmpR family regulator